MILRSSVYRRINVSVVAIASWFAPIASSSSEKARPRLSTEMLVWNAAHVQKTVPLKPFTLIPMTVAAVLPISSTAGWPGSAENLRQVVAVDRDRRG